jgi:hypothetical protein
LPSGRLTAYFCMCNKPSQNISLFFNVPLSSLLYGSLFTFVDTKSFHCNNPHLPIVANDWGSLDRISLDRNYRSTLFMITRSNFMTVFSRSKVLLHCNVKKTFDRVKFTNSKIFEKFLESWRCDLFHLYSLSVKGCFYNDI